MPIIGIANYQYHNARHCEPVKQSCKDKKTKTAIAFRPQLFADACNLLAIKDSVVIGYARNERTAKAFEEHLDYRVIKSRYLIQQFETGELLPESIEKTLILLPSSELSRARVAYIV